MTNYGLFEYIIFKSSEFSEVVIYYIYFTKLIILLNKLILLQKNKNISQNFKSK